MNQDFIMNIDQLSHHFLVATPALDDPCFTYSVVYVYEHKPEGAMGLIINKPFNIWLPDLFNHLEINLANQSVADVPVFMGGPVNKEHGFILYLDESKDTDANEPLEISSSKETLHAIANNLGPKMFLVTLGYAGWGAGQLELEVHRGDWLVVPYNKSILFQEPIDKRWLATAKLLNVDLTRLSLNTGHA